MLICCYCTPLKGWEDKNSNKFISSCLQDLFIKFSQRKKFLFSLKGLFSKHLYSPVTFTQCFTLLTCFLPGWVETREIHGWWAIMDKKGREKWSRRIREHHSTMSKPGLNLEGSYCRTQERKVKLFVCANTSGKNEKAEQQSSMNRGKSRCLINLIFF